LANALVNVVFGPPPQSELDVLLHGQVWKKRVVLEDSADVALVGLQMLDAGAIQPDLADGRLLETGHQPERGCLSAARGTEQREELAASDLKRNAVDCALGRIVL
jgi:hypothetical protein